MSRTTAFVCWLVLLTLAAELGRSQETKSKPTDQVTVSYRQVTAVLSKYCVGCHNASDHEGDFSVSTYASFMAGSDDGPVIVAGNVEESKLLKVLAGQLEPKMPPEDEPQPSADDIHLIRQWIEQGALGDGAIGGGAEMTAELSINPPQLPQALARFQHVGAACSVGDHTFAIGLFGEVQLKSHLSAKPLWIAQGLSGKVNALRVSPDGRWLTVGGGVAGVGGEALVLDVDDGHVRQRVVGHGDTIYCVALSPDQRTLATGSYDRKVILWDVSSGEKIRELSGHNGAIYDLDFDASGELLATASADQTVKLWQVATGLRLDTLGQSEGEQRCVRFSPDGQRLVAAGADKQIRQWQVVSRTKSAINPLLVARFAHESDIVQLAFQDNQRLLSASTDMTVKLWDAAHIMGLGTLAKLSDVPVGLCLMKSPATTSHVIQLDGQQIALESDVLQRTDLERGRAEAKPPISAAIRTLPSPDAAPEITQVAESEPNDTPQQASRLALPGIVTGTIAASQAGKPDQDLLRFTASQGETWIVEVSAASQGSPLDSRIEILDIHGAPVERTRLQATRESYFTFRGKDSMTSDDFRLHKWEDMELDEYLYSNGEVSRLWHYPRGPDSGFRVYPGAGNRHAFFDTTPLSHALGQTTYIVRELADGEKPLPNGLPVFPIYYENDDDSQIRLGKDSRLTFVAPTSGDYLLRIRDARGFSGEDFNYQVAIRRPHPDFALKLADTKMSLPIHSGREWSAQVTRIDGLEGPIAIRLEGIPEGVHATNPLIIEAGQQTAVGVLYVTQAAHEQLGEQKQFEVKLTAQAQAGEQTIERELEEKLVVTITEDQEVQLRLVYADEPSREIEQLEIQPGQTISARVLIERNGTTSRIELGGDSAGRNLPHGAFVDNIGLNGLLIPEGQTEREFFITAAPKVVPGRRQFHLKSGTSGNPTSRPIWLNVRSPDE